MNIDLHKKIKAQKFSSLYLLYGKETYFIDETIQLLVSNVLNDEERDFNLSVYDLEEVPVDAALEDAQTLPFFGDKRVVICKNAVFLTGAKEKSKIDHNLQLLEEYITSPSPNAILIFMVDAEKLDERKKVTKLLKKEAEVFEATMNDEKSLISWIHSEVKQLEVTIEEEAVGILIQYVRGTVTLLVQELHKMAMYVGKNGNITSEVVQLLSSRTIEDNIFELIDCVLSNKVPKAMEIYHDLLKLNEEPIKILSLLSSQFRLLYQVKDLSKRGYGQQQIATHLKIHPYRVKLAAQKATQFSNEYLTTSLNELAEMDYRIKSGQIDKKLAIELFILKQYRR
ncbi:DNA polymerase III subunit delta [Bacillus pinisoli]|uniref:DNA polymerase III subunit delta n=1 Tax=Bacillus pinisoli TaxID=2901866 RepID=UPI001FF1B9BE|nr:DNA polymerase III subunit delta [Bacillus pinisoli]